MKTEYRKIFEKISAGEYLKQKTIEKLIALTSGDISKSDLKSDRSNLVSKRERLYEEKKMERKNLWKRLTALAAVVVVAVALAITLPILLKGNDVTGTAGLSYTAIFENGEVIGYSVSKGTADTNGTVVIAENYNGKPVITIEKDAFKGCADLTKITLPDTIKHIGESAFESCSKLAEVNIVNGVKSIGTLAFKACVALESITIPENVVTIEAYAFADSTNLTITVQGHTEKPSGWDEDWNKNQSGSGTVLVTWDTDSLKGTRTGDSVTMADWTYGSAASEPIPFFGEAGETIVTYLYKGTGSTNYQSSSEKPVNAGTYEITATFIANEDFNAATAVSTFTIFRADGSVSVSISGWMIGQSAQSPEPVIITGDYTNPTYHYKTQGAGDGSYTTTVPSVAGNYTVRVTYAATINYNAATATANFAIEEEEEAFGTPGLAYQLISGKYHVSKGTATDADVIIPSTYNGLPVTEIAYSGFHSYTNMTSISIPNSVTIIGNFAFQNCGNLDNLVIPNSVTNIGYQAFSHCSNLQNLTFKENSQLDIIGQQAFDSCSSLLSVAIPSGVTSIGEIAFFYCNSLTSISIPSSVISIGGTEPMLGYCISLVSITVETGNTVYRSEGNCIIRIADNTIIAGCKNSVIPDGIKAIGGCAFRGCGIVSVIIPNSVEDIGGSAFSGCSNLTSVTFEAGSQLKSIGDQAFRYSGLLNIIIPQGVEIIDQNAFSISSLESIIFEPNSQLKSIGDAAFAYCHFTSIIIPESVETIGKYAFYLCTHLESIVFEPNSQLKTIGQGAFDSCSGLKSIIIISNNVTSIGNSAFDGYNLTIYVEAESKPAGWDSNWNISNRPVVWGCTLSADKTYVVSFTKTSTSISNPTAISGISAPYREGYTFGGWAISEEDAANYISAYTAANVNSAPDGTTLYAIWIED
ncbi:MAG: leucine-rich repeat protein [Firmicutes bacterium]|nr:leucine-rich repeat protein [Bacillota bacterium]